MPDVRLCHMCRAVLDETRTAHCRQCWLGVRYDREHNARCKPIIERADDPDGHGSTCWDCGYEMVCTFKPCVSHRCMECMDNRAFEEFDSWMTEDLPEDQLV